MRLMRLLAVAVLLILTAAVLLAEGPLIPPVGSLSLATGSRAVRPSSNGALFVGGPVTPFVLSIDLRTLVGGAPGEPSVLVSKGPFSTPIVSFDGIDAITSSAPVPDTNGAVGPNHYIQSVNGKFAVFDKTGTMLLNPFTYFKLWEAANSQDECENANIDPIVLYDHLADRWLISATAFTNECIAISRTPDPIAGGWFLYNFPCPDGVCDYSKLSVWPDAYYMGTHWSPPPGLAWAFDRTNMLLGNPAIFIHFGYSTPPSFNTFMLPSDLKGSPPPAGAPNVFLRFVDGADPIQGLGGVDRLELSEFHVDFSNPLLSTFTALPDLPTAPFDSNVCGDWNDRACITQPGTTQKVDSKSEMPMYPLVYRNFGTYETLIVSHAVRVAFGFHSTVGIRWYELRKVSGVWSIFQEGDYSPDATNRWMGSMSMDKAGNIALGYSVSSDTVFPGIRYTGRLQSDPAGTMPQGEFTLIAGGSSQTPPPTPNERWGDYSAMQVDPVDGCTFWYTNQYYSANYIGWRTRIAAFRFSECGIASANPVGPVGSVVEPVNKLAVFAPYLALFAVVASVAIVIAKPWKRHEN
jgi:hypothetical protein